MEFIRHSTKDKLVNASYLERARPNRVTKDGKVWNTERFLLALEVLEQFGEKVHRRFEEA